MDAENYNILQNNGRLAHQEVDHVSRTSRNGAHGQSVKLIVAMSGTLSYGMRFRTACEV